MDDNAPQKIYTARPDLKRESLVFSAVQGIAFGAALGAAAHLVTKLASKTPPKISFLTRMALWGAGAGIGVMAGASVRNDQKDAVRPYVEQLEQEMVKRDIATGANQQR